MRLQDHPTVLQARPQPPPPDVLDGAWLTQLARDAGADDVVSRGELLGGFAGLLKRWWPAAEPGGR